MTEVQNPRLQKFRQEFFFWKLTEYCIFKFNYYIFRMSVASLGLEKIKLLKLVLLQIAWKLKKTEKCRAEEI